MNDIFQEEDIQTACVLFQFFFGCDPGPRNMGNSLFFMGELNDPNALGVMLSNRHDCYQGYKVSHMSWLDTETQANLFVKRNKKMLSQVDLGLVERQMTDSKLAGFSSTIDTVVVGSTVLSACSSNCSFAIRNDPAHVANEFAFLFPSILHTKSKTITIKKNTEEGRREHNKECIICTAEEKGLVTLSEREIVGNNLLYLKQRASINGYTGVKTKTDDYWDSVMDIFYAIKRLYHIDLVQRRLKCYEERTRIKYLVFLHSKSSMIQRWRRPASKNELHCVLILSTKHSFTERFFENNFFCHFYLTNISNDKFPLYVDESIEWIYDLSQQNVDDELFISDLFSQFHSKQIVEPKETISKKFIPLKKRIYKNDVHEKIIKRYKK